MQKTLIIFSFFYFFGVKYLLNRLENNSSKLKPSESMLRALFEVFGPLRTVDIPMLDPYRPKMVSNPPNTFAFGQDGLFEAFVQYQEYVGFLKCMTAFRGMKLLYKEGNRAWAAFVQVMNKIQKANNICMALPYYMIFFFRLTLIALDTKAKDLLSSGKSPGKD